MYHCCIHFYLTGRACRAFEVIKEMTPLVHFSHVFSGDDRQEEGRRESADVIFVNAEGMDKEEALRLSLRGKSERAELILLAREEQIPFFSEGISEISDIWRMPAPEEEIRFRFLRWQQSYKMRKDFWQTQQYLDATINHIPNLIWYKDKNGIHEKVNDSFLKTVNKERAQVEGKGHAYIWDVEEDDPACIESELEVMRKEQTCVSEETIRAGDGMRTLTTYKSPLYDLDGSVMGTVGVAIDVTQERAYEQEIISKNQTLETIFTTIDCGVIRHTVDGEHVLSINRAALQILGYETQEEMIRDGFCLTAASVLEEDREKLNKDIKTLKKEGDSVSVEYRVRHNDGEVLHIMGNIKLLKENGRLIYQRFLLDCTAQKQQEKRNERRQMELFQALSIDYNLVCFFDLDTGGGICLRDENNRGMQGDLVFGREISLKESMEQYIQEFVFEEDREMLRRAISVEVLKERLAVKKIYYINYRVLQDGKMIYSQVKAVRTGTESGNFGAVLGFRSVDGEIRREMEQRTLLEDALF